MWLLSTSRAELREFTSPETVAGGYAILSHVWGEQEQTFEYTQWLHDTCLKFGTNPRDQSSPKIKGACMLAESHGYEWIWVDTSCIDKSSSAALSEAINSMYRYYSLAKICYVYLHDVPAQTYLSQRGSAFYRSKWHTRGWTLQELIAPPFVLFLADNWTHVGTKAELADLLESITRVPAGLLRLETGLTDYSLAQRMSWAASRETTRAEDRAYSLLGIFGINMSTLYGEGGEAAFYRLQEKIMKRIEDTTLFAWGRRGASSGQSPSSPDPIPLEHQNNAEGTYLLASSPAAFRNCRNITFTPPTSQSTGRRDGNRAQRVSASRERSPGIPRFSITPYGILARVPLIEDWEDSAIVIAHLFWSDGGSHGLSLGLRLKRRLTSADPERPHYDVAGSEGRLVPLFRDPQGRLMDHNSQFVRPSWRKIYITHRPPPELVVPQDHNRILLPINLGSYAPFRISNDNFMPLAPSAPPRDLTLTAWSFEQHPWVGNPPAILQFEIQESAPWRYQVSPIRHYAMLHLGVCLYSSVHWAVVRSTTDDLETYTERHGDEQHSCLLDHIHTWTDRKRTFEFVGGADNTAGDVNGSGLSWTASIELSFHPCPISPQTTLVASISKLQDTAIPEAESPTLPPFEPPTPSDTVSEYWYGFAAEPGTGIPEPEALPPTATLATTDLASEPGAATPAQSVSAMTELSQAADDVRVIPPPPRHGMRRDGYNLRWERYAWRERHRPGLQTMDDSDSVSSGLDGPSEDDDSASDLDGPLGRIPETDNEREADEPAASAGGMDPEAAETVGRVRDLGVDGQPLPAVGVPNEEPPPETGRDGRAVDGSVQEGRDRAPEPGGSGRNEVAPGESPGGEVQVQNEGEVRSEDNLEARGSDPVPSPPGSRRAQTRKPSRLRSLFWFLK